MSSEPERPGTPVPAAGPLGLGILPEILWAPTRAFERLAAAPRWVGPFLLVLALNLVGSYLALPAVLQLQADSAVSMMERLGLPEDQQAEALASLPDPDDRSPGVLFKNVGAGVLGVAALGMLGAAILLGLGRMMGHSTTWRGCLAVYWAAAIASGLGAVLKYGMMAATGSAEVTLGPGALFPDLPFHSAPAILLDVLDVFSLWNLALLGVGLSVTVRISRGAAFTVAGIYWLLKAVFTAGSRFFLAWMMGGG